MQSRPLMRWAGELDLQVGVGRAALARLSGGVFRAPTPAEGDIPA
jgi:hypothetical protein